MNEGAGLGRSSWAQSMAGAAMAAALSACGGGGSSPAPAAVPAAMTLAECEAKPAGLANTYLNSPRNRREWVAASFEGQAVIARREYDSAGTLIQARYYREDAAARTSTLVAREWYDSTGTLLRRIRFSGNTLSLALAPGQSQTIQYTWQVLEPLGEPGGSESLTLRYDGNETISLPQGRLEACRTTQSVSSDSAAPLTTETVYSTRGANVVKSYLHVTEVQAVDHEQTYLTELASSSATLAFAPPTADSAPTLASCSALPPGLDLTFTASTAGEASTARRATASSATAQGASSIGMQRRHVDTLELRSTYHFDPAVGFLLQLGVEFADGFSGTVLSGRPDLRNTAIGSSVDYAETTTAYPSGFTSVANDRFTFLGHEKLTTPAGTFDTCKLRFNYGVGFTETYWLVPNRFFARIETTLPRAGGTVTTSRELIAP